MSMWRDGDLPCDVNETLKQIQAATRAGLIDDLYHAARRIYLRAVRLVGVGTDLSRAISSLEVYDRSALYAVYQKIAVYFRVAHDDGGQTDFISWTFLTESAFSPQADDYPQKITSRWLEYLAIGVEVKDGKATASSKLKIEPVTIDSFSARSDRG